MKVAIIANCAFTVINFRYDLIKKLGNECHEVYVICAEDEYICSDAERSIVMKELRINYFPISFSRRGMNLLGEIMILIKLMGIIKKINPDIVINYTIKPVLYGTLISWICGVKKIFSNITGLGYVFMTDTLKAKLLKVVIKAGYRFVLKRNQSVFFQNYDDLNYFVKEGMVSANKAVKINGSGVDTSFFMPSGQAKKYDFLFVGRLIADKGLREYVQACRELKKIHSDLKAVVVGFFDEHPSSITREEMQMWVDEQVIEYLGSTKDVRSILDISKIFVLPSYREGTPKTALEAMSMSLPVITTDVPGCREVVQNLENGFLVKARDVSSLYLAMLNTYRNDTLIEEMGNKSRQIAVERFDVAQVNKVILNTVMR